MKNRSFNYVKELTKNKNLKMKKGYLPILLLNERKEDLHSHQCSFHRLNALFSHFGSKIFLPAILIPHHHKYTNDQQIPQGQRENNQQK